MPTTKDRINITVEPELYRLLTQLSRKSGASLSSYTKALVERALELEEDRYFSAVADERLAAGRPLVRHEDAWA